MTVSTGIFGTFSGGYVLDLVGSSVRNGMILGAVSMALASCVILVAFLTASSFLVFCVVFSIGEFLLFFVQAPSNALILWSVPRDERAIAVSLSVVCMHVLGDVPGPPLMGFIQQHVTNEWRFTMSLAVIIIAVGAICFSLGLRMAYETEETVDTEWIEEETGDDRSDDDRETRQLVARQ
jgi:MFS family permease